MADNTTKRMLRAYFQRPTTTQFFTGMFQSPPENFYDGEEVEIDIERSGEQIAIVVQDLSTGYRENAADIYTSKTFKPPIFKEAITLNAFDLLKRMPGNDPYQNPQFRAAVQNKMMQGMNKVARKIDRAQELQAAQVMQTGTVTLSDETGAPLYELDFKPKASHFPTAAIAWGTAGATIYDDIQALSEEVRTDGQQDPDELVMGINAFNAFIKDEEIQKVFDNRRIDQGMVSMMRRRGDGGIFRGVVEIGNYSYDIWTYNGRYEDPQTQIVTPYLDPAKVIIRSSGARLDRTFGSIPNFNDLLGGGRQMFPEFPRRFNSAVRGQDLHTNIWKTNDGEQLKGGVGTRPLFIPTAIDTYGCLDTGA